MSTSLKVLCLVVSAILLSCGKTGGVVDTEYIEMYQVDVRIKVHNCSWASLRVKYETQHYSKTILDYSKERLNSAATASDDFADHVQVDAQRRTKLVIHEGLSKRTVYSDYPPGHLVLFLDGKNVASFQCLEPTKESALTYNVTWTCSATTPAPM